LCFFVILDLIVFESNEMQSRFIVRYRGRIRRKDMPNRNGKRNIGHTILHKIVVKYHFFPNCGSIFRSAVTPKVARVQTIIQMKNA